MKDIINDPFSEYMRQEDPDRRKLAHAWHTGIGLQAVDRLETSAYLQQTARDNIDGKITMAEANDLITRYYEESPKHDVDRHKEADLVSARIAAILSEEAFVFSVPQLIGIHARLFSGIYDHAGKLRDYNISKKEWVLNGATVTYGDAQNLMDLLAYDISEEKKYRYPFSNIYDIIPHLASFVANLWQIHAFAEGNTRTTAVFFIKYLRSMGFPVTNDIFAKNALYFRNALVRANYTDWTKGIRGTTEYLELFLKNLLAGENNELKNRYLHIQWNVEKQDIDAINQDIGQGKQDIVLPDVLSERTRKNILALLDCFGFDQYFGRTEVMETLSLTASPASALIRKMLSYKLIVSISGHGKGKYIFKNGG